MTHTPQWTLLIIGVIGFGLTLASPRTVLRCYGFDELAAQAVYQVHDNAQIEQSRIDFYPLFDESLNPLRSDGQAWTSRSDRPGSVVTLLLKPKILLQVIPEQRMKRVTLDFAEEIGSGDSLANLGVNGEMRAWHGNLKAQNGERMGLLNSGGRVTVSVSKQPGDDDRWVKWRLSLLSDPAQPTLPKLGIWRFSLGRDSSLRIDNLCLERL